jgi:steroid 5-alpha reductase family enzyme
MNIIATAAILIVTLLGVPAYSYFFGTALGPVEIEALRTVAYIAAGSVVACFVIGELTDNVSQVDKVWSVLPIIYAWIVACYGDYSLRLILMALLATVWGLRLTFNFSRHGAYQWKFWGGHEDYRWGVLRARPEFQGKWRWSLFNFAFISGYQNALILLFTLPTIVALQNNQAPLNALDFCAAALMLCFITFETVADNQQWSYQSKKWSMIRAGEQLTGDYKKGFLDKGLWAYSRHPNYFAEQCNWICFYLLSVAASGQWFNWSVTGCLLLMIMFRESSKFSEETSASKYPEYAGYQQKVPRFIPFRLLFK